MFIVLISLDFFHHSKYQNVLMKKYLEKNCEIFQRRLHIKSNDKNMLHILVSYNESYFGNNNDNGLSHLPKL